jgi:hypothetical protein
MASIADANYSSSKTYNDGEILDEIDLDNTNNYLQTYMNARKNDLLRLANDAQGSDYTLDGTSTRLYTHDLFEKQNSQGIGDVGADISIGLTADAGYSNVSAGVAVVSFTPERQGTYRISFDFTHIISLDTALNAQISTAFRFTDGGVLTSPVIVSGALTQTYARVWHPVHLELVAEMETTPYTFLLQKRNLTANNASANVVGASPTGGQINHSVEKI